MVHDIIYTVKFTRFLNNLEKYMITEKTGFPIKFLFTKKDFLKYSNWILSKHAEEHAVLTSSLIINQFIFLNIGFVHSCISVGGFILLRRQTP